MKDYHIILPSQHKFHVLGLKQECFIVATIVKGCTSIRTCRRCNEILVELWKYVLSLTPTFVELSKFGQESKTLLLKFGQNPFRTTVQFGRKSDFPLRYFLQYLSNEK